MVNISTNELYACSYKEVITILSFLSDEEWNKIPKEKKDFYFENMNKEYEFEYDATKTIEEQELLEPTKPILANIFKKYLATDIEKQEIQQRDREKFIKSEELKREKYTPDNLFVKRNDNNTRNDHTIKDNTPVVIKKISIFERLSTYIKNIFKGK